MKKNNKVLQGLVLIYVLLVACANPKDIVYYQNVDNQSQQGASQPSYEIAIQPDDLLTIIVSAENPEIAMPFNLSTVAVNSASNPNVYRGQETIQPYLVDAKGNIQFPVLGELHVGGLSRTEVLTLLQSKIGAYIKQPIINIRITNFKISVQGEVTSPGVFTVNSERITLIEALSLARDLTIYGNRHKVMVIREQNGQRTYNTVDIAKADFINSPYYYLSQNDVVYVEPNKTKMHSSAVGPNTSVILSSLSLLLSVCVLIFK